MPSDFVTANDHVYFTVLNGGAIWKLWETDGTAAGTKPVADGLSSVYGEPYSELAPGTKNTLPDGYILPPGHHGIGNVTAIGDTVWAYELQYTGSHSLNIYLRSFKADGTTTRDTVGAMSTSVFDYTLSEIRDVGGKPVFYFGYNGDPVPAELTAAQWYTANGNGDVVESSDQSYSYDESRDGYLNPEPFGVSFGGTRANSAVIGDRRIVAYDDGTHGIELGSLDANETAPTPPVTPVTGVPVTSVDYTSLGADGILRITGTTAGDTITLGRVYKHANWLELKANGVTERIAFSAVKQIRVNLGAGNDAFTISETHGSIALAASVAGGAGDDTISTGAGADTLYGQDGRDNLYGNGNRDRLDGGDGDDRLIGGAGADVLYGQAGNDRFMNFTTHERKDTVDDILA